MRPAPADAVAPDAPPVRPGVVRATSRLLAALSLLLLPLASHCAAQSGSKARIVIEAVGNERGTWLLCASSRSYSSDLSGGIGDGLLNVFAWQRVGGAKLEAAQLTPEVGRIARWAASGSSLFVFFDDGTHRSYSLDARQIEIDLPGRAVPDAITGMIGDRGRSRVGLYAVVSHETGLEVVRSAREATTRPTTAGATSRMAPATATAPRDDSESREPAQGSPPEPPQISALGTDIAEGGFDLVAYENTRWRLVAPITGLPEGFKTDRLWLCASPQAVFMFWPVAGAAGEASVLRCRCWRDGHWAVLSDIELDATLEYGAALYLEPRVAFAAGLRGSGPSPHAGATAPAAKDAVWRVWSLIDDRWRAGEPFVFDPKQGGTPQTAPGQTALAALGQNVFVATVEHDREIGVGVWPPEGGPAKRRFEETKVFDLPRKPLLDPQTRDWLGLLIVLGVLMAVFWTRQDSLMTSPVLPRGLVLAAYGKRFLATVLDLLPAAVVTSWLWYAPGAAYLDEWYKAGATWKETVPAAPDRLLAGWLLIRLVYATYCAVFESLWGATPGKRLFGCRVLTETGRPPALREIVIRNAVRVAELEVYLPLWSLMLILFFTRNRQRLGDLLARTIVVEPGRPVSRNETDDDLF